jgi:signal transduction histidine kinase/CHASE3 domain sensor protein
MCSPAPRDPSAFGPRETVPSKAASAREVAWGPAVRATRVAIVAGLVVAVALNVFLSWRAGAAADELRTREFELVRQARVLDAEAPALLSDGRGFMLTADPRFVRDFEADRDEARVALGRLRSLVQTPESSSLVDTIEAALESVINGVERRLRLAEEGRLDEIRGELLDATAPQRDLFGLLDQLVEREENLLRERLDELRRERLIGLAISALVLGVVGALAIGLLTRSQRAIEASQRELVERARESRLGADVGAALTSGDVFQVKLQRSAEAIVRNIEAAFARIWTLNEDENVLELRASAGMYTHLNGVHSRVPVGKFMIGLIAQERQPHLTNSVVGDPRVDQEWARREGMVAFAGYPLNSGDRLVGVMAVFARHPLSKTTLGALASVADEVAIAIDQARVEQERAQLLVLEQAARAAAEENVRTRDQFLSSAAHDLKNPLASIKGYAQLLQRQARTADPPLPARLVEGLAQIDVTATKMGALIDELLDVALLQTGRSLELNRQAIDLVALARQVVVEHQQTTDRHRVMFHTTEDELVGFWDAARLERVIANLVNNAIKYSPEGGEVIVRINRDTDEASWAVLAVEDHGIGIPESDLPRVFERFQRGANVQGRIGGVGIGLASARQIVEQHGGSIGVQSQKGVGSTFTVRLLLDKEQPPARELRGPTDAGAAPTVES